MYRTLGCFHSLQPTPSPFETPKTPCLTHAGFARWQTVQLLLSPQDHVGFLQKAVHVYDVPRPDGGYFPSTLPRECLPQRPDDAMEKWYKQVTGSLNQESYMRRLKYSPAGSPHLEPTDRRESYFPKGLAPPPRPSRGNSQDEDQVRLANKAAYRRRSSVPDLPSPVPAGADRGSHWDSSTRKERQARSHSASRPAQHSRQRSHTTTTPDRYAPKKHESPSHRNSSHPLDQRSYAHSRPTSSQQQSHHRPRPSAPPKSASTLDETTGSEGSSEASQNGRYSRQRRSDEERKSRSGLWVPSFLRSSNKRRHSSEAGTRKIEAAKPQPPVPAPLRPEYYAPKGQHIAPAMVAPGAAPPVMPVHSHRQPAQPSSSVHFRNDMFDNDARHATPKSPAAQPVMQPNGLPPPAIRFPDAQPHSPYPMQQMEGMSMAAKTASHESSGGSGTDRRYHSGSDWERNAARKAGQPLRVATVTGVSGRKYANADPASAERHAARVRGSVSTPVV